MRRKLPRASALRYLDVAMSEPTTHRILVVDDEPDITALVAYHLAKAGYRVATAANGRDALRAAREERPDLVVLDLMLPGASGYDVLTELRRLEETKDLGVIVLTARKEEPGCSFSNRFRSPPAPAMRRCAAAIGRKARKRGVPGPSGRGGIWGSVPSILRPS